MTCENLRELQAAVNAMDNSDLTSDKVIFEQVFNAIERRIELGFFGYVAATNYRHFLSKFVHDAQLDDAAIVGNDELFLLEFKEKHVEKSLRFIVDFVNKHAKKNFPIDDFHIDFAEEIKRLEKRKSHLELLRREELKQYEDDRKKFLSDDFKSARRQKLTDLIKQIFYRHKRDKPARKLLLAAFPLTGKSKLETLKKSHWLKPATLAKFFQSIGVVFDENLSVDDPFTEEEICVAEKFAVETIKKSYADEVPRDRILEVAYFDVVTKYGYEIFFPPPPTMPTKPPQFISESTAAKWLNETPKQLQERAKFCELKTFTSKTDKKIFYDFYEIEMSVHVAIDETRGRYPIVTKTEFERCRKIFDVFKIPKDGVIIIDDNTTDAEIEKLKNKFVGM